MCVAGLNVSTQPCQHRWVHLKRPCNPANNLANCPERLKLEGWESRVDHCPFCDEHPVNQGTHRLFGSMSSIGSAPASPEIPGMTRTSRSNSLGTISTLSRQNSCGSEHYFHDRGQFHRDMNERLLNYLMTDLHETLPSAKKNYPTYSSAASSSKEEATTSDVTSIRSVRPLLSRSWRKSVRISKGLFKT